MRARGRKLSLILAAIVLVFLLVLVALPYAIKWIVQDQLIERGAATATISDVNFNPFKGTLVIQDLDVREPGGRQLSARYTFVDIDWLALFERHVAIRNIELNGARVSLRLGEDGKWYLSGLSEPIIDPDRPAEPAAADEQTGEPWTVQLQSVSLKATRLGYAMPQWEGSLQIEALEILEFNTRNVDQTTHVDFEGELNATPVRIEAALTPLAQPPEYQLQTRLDGLDLTQLQAFLPDEWEVAAGRFTIDGDWTIRQPRGDAWLLSYTGNLALADPELGHPQMQAASDVLEWSGAIELTLPGGEAAPALSLDGEVTNTGLDLQLSEPGLAIRRERMTFTGTLAIPDLNTPEALSLNATIDNQGLQVRQTEPARRLLEAEALEVRDLSIDGLDAIRAAGVSATALRTLAPLEDAAAGEPVFASPSVALSNIRLQDRRRLMLEKIALGEARIRLTRQADGSWRGLTGPDTAAPAEAPASASQAAASASAEPTGEPPFRVQIDELGMSAGSTFIFTDRGVDPTYVNEVNIEEFRLDELDTGEPEQALQLALEARSEKYSGLSATGWLKPFGEHLSSDIDLSIEHLTLPPLSPYMAMATGYSIHSGSLSADSKIDIDAGQMNIQNELRLDQFHVKPLSEEKRQRIDQSLSMPLNTALSTLRDDNDNIALSLPITGSIEDPNFDISDAINQALAKALKTAAVSYIKFALQPYGTLIAIGQIVGEQMGNIKLEPIAFANGSAELDYESRQYLQKIRDLLHNRPELQLRICGYAVPADREALRAQRLAEAKARAEAEQQDKSEGATVDKDKPPPEPEIEPIADQTLLDLAERRARAIQDALVETHDVEPGRLFVCRPELETDADAKARTALSL